MSHLPAGASLSATGKRFLGYLLDLLLVIVTLGVGYLIWSLIVWGKGQTPAKALLGMCCVDSRTGQPVPRGTMFEREVIYKAGAGYFTVGITVLISCRLIAWPPRQALWDRWASTAVVDLPTTGGA